MQVSGELLRQCISCWTVELILTRYCTIEFLHAHLTFRLSERAWYACANNSVNMIVSMCIVYEGRQKGSCSGITVVRVLVSVHYNCKFIRKAVKDV